MKCKDCGTKSLYAIGIGYFCPNTRCGTVDCNQVERPKKKMRKKRITDGGRHNITCCPACFKDGVKAGRNENIQVKVKKVGKRAIENIKKELEKKLYEESFCPCGEIRIHICPKGEIMKAYLDVEHDRTIGEVENKVKLMGGHVIPKGDILRELSRMKRRRH